MRFSTFEELAALPVDDLLGVLASGDSRERVWATWALGLRLEEQMAPILAHLLALDPDAGTRQHATVVLAGLAPLDAVARTAARDRDPRVRATALGLMSALSEVKDPRLLDVVGKGLASGTDEERIAILDRLPVPIPEILRELALAQAAHASEDVRTAAREKIAADPTLRDRLPMVKPSTEGASSDPVACPSSPVRWPLLVRG